MAPTFIFFIGSRNLYLLGKYNHFSISPVKAVIPK